MGYIEIFTADENGAGWKNFDELNEDEKISLAVDVMLAEEKLVETKILCAFCLVEIEKGTGNACVNCKNKNAK